MCGFEMPVSRLTGLMGRLMGYPMECCMGFENIMGRPVDVWASYVL